MVGQRDTLGKPVPRLRSEKPRLEPCYYLCVIWRPSFVRFQIFQISRPGPRQAILLVPESVTPPLRLLATGFDPSCKHCMRFPKIWGRHRSRHAAPDAIGGSGAKLTREAEASGGVDGFLQALELAVGRSQGKGGWGGNDVRGRKNAAIIIGVESW